MLKDVDHHDVLLQKLSLINMYDVLPEKLMADQHDVLLEELWFDKHNLPGESRVDKHVLRSGQTCLTCGTEC